jgi:hypothetical protein
MRDSAAVVPSSSRTDERTGKETSRPEQSDEAAVTESVLVRSHSCTTLQVANESET